MNKHTVDTRTTAALRDLDPAGPTVLTDAERERADATFARILATPSHDHVPEEPDRPRRRRSRLLVLVPVGLVGAVVPAVLLSGGSAFASWTPKPGPLTSAAVTSAATTCRAALAPANQPALAVPDQGERVVIAERRGEWTYVLMAGPKAEASCLMSDDLVRQGVRADHKAGFFGNYSTDPGEAPTLARDRIVEFVSMGGSVSTPGRWPFTTDKEWVSWVQGYVGSDVTGVTVHPPVGPDVEASVDSGRFAAWWPGGEVRGDNPGVSGAWTYTVTLTDGSTRLTSCYSSTSPC
ncbi:MAG TPA: hypothetical protein VLL08_08810 [Kineosporiaceae bacterium]|nr:hypothetical protein [Kineosporiaceae bacterium]